MLAFYFLSTDSPNVDFCGYTITHPSESKINFRIQTRGETFVLSSFLFSLSIFLLIRSSFVFTTQSFLQHKTFSVTYTTQILKIKIALIAIVVSRTFDLVPHGDIGYGDTFDTRLALPPFLHYLLH